MRQRKTGKINLWKWAFLLLLSALLGFSLILVTRLTSSREDLPALTATTSDTDTKIGTFSTTREQLNATIATYLQDYQTDGFTYKLYVTSQLVIFEGSYQIFGVTIPLTIYFQPSELDDGSVQLAISEISAGTLSLPRGEILTYLQKNYKLPEFVQIEPDTGLVHVQLANMENNLGIYAKANTIDLYNDQILFDLYKKVN